MKLKCIGGPNDGKYCEVPEYVKQNDIWRVPDKDIYYKVEQLIGPGLYAIKFLIPADSELWD